MRSPSLLGFFVPVRLAKYVCPMCTDYTQGYWFLFCGY
jgi:NMD protein affecting ribosome stability and mRNA decay